MGENTLFIWKKTALQVVGWIFWSLLLHGLQRINGSHIWTVFTVTKQAIFDLLWLEKNGKMLLVQTPVQPEATWLKVHYWRPTSSLFSEAFLWMFLKTQIPSGGIYFKSSPIWFNHEFITNNLFFWNQRSRMWTVRYSFRKCTVRPCSLWVGNNADKEGRDVSHWKSISTLSSTVH